MPSLDRWLYAWGLGYVAVGGASLLVPVYALHLGADAFVVGLLASTAAFAGIPGALLCGPLAERTGRSGAVVVATLLVMAAALGGMAIVRSVDGVILLNAIFWFAVAAAAPVCNLVVVTGHPDADWDDRLGELNSVQGYGWVLGLGFCLVWLAGARLGSPGLDQQSLLGLLAGFTAVSAVAVQAWFPPASGGRPTASRLGSRFRRVGRRDLGAGRILRLNPLGSGRLYWATRNLGWDTIREPLSGPIGLYLLGTAAFATGSAVFWGPMPAYLDDRGLATAAIFGVFFAGNVGSAITYGRVATLEPIVGALRLQVGGIAARAILFPGTVVVAGSSVALLGGFLLLVGVSWALVAVTAPLLVSRLAGPSRRGAALAVYTAAMSAGTGLGSILGGAIATTSGYLVTFGLAGLTVLVGSILAWRGLASEAPFGPAGNAPSDST